MKNEKVCWVLRNTGSSVCVKIPLWVARVWSLSAFTLAMVVAFTPDPYAVNLIKVREGFMLSFWLAANLGLLIAWRFERVGA